MIDFLWIRIDQNESGLFEGVISCLIKYINNQEGKWQKENWELNEGIVDFILNKTSIAKLSSEFIPTLSFLSKTQGQYGDIVQKSKEYYRKLGFPIKGILSIKDNQIINGRKIINDLTSSEKFILKELIRNKGSVVRFGRVSDILWRREKERYSAWALAKVIQRIREKLKENGIKSELIHTYRKQGYVLFD